MKTEKRKRPLSPGKEKRPETRSNRAGLHNQNIAHPCFIVKLKAQLEPVKLPGHDRVQAAGNHTMIAFYCPPLPRGGGLLK